MNDWEAWFDASTQGESARAIASKIPYSHSTISSWRRAERPPADAVFTIARAYGADVFAGLRAAGWLTEGDCETALSQLLSQTPTRRLIAELHSRSEGFEPSLMTDPNMLV